VRGQANSPLEGLGDRWLGQAMVKVYDKLNAKGLLEQTIDHDDHPDTPNLSRRQAYSEMFKANRDYVISAMGRGHAPNQDLGQMLAMYWDNRSIELLMPSEAWPQSKVLAYLDSSVGLANDVYGGYWISQKGIPLEPNGTSSGGYTGEYGPHCVDMVARIAALT